VGFRTGQSVRFRTENGFVYARIVEIQANSAVVQELAPSASAWSPTDKRRTVPLEALTAANMVSRHTATVDLPRLDLTEVKRRLADSLQSKIDVNRVTPKQSDVIAIASDDPRLSIQVPTAGMLKKINETIVPRGGMPYSAEEVTHLPLIVADNMVSRSLSKWAAASLATMSKLIVGQPVKFDHDWKGADSTWARIYDATIVKSDSASSQFLNRVGNGALNRKIIADEGLIQVVAFVAAPSDSKVLEAFQRGILSEVSVGNHLFTEVNCPECNTSFFNAACPHAVPWSKQTSALYSDMGYSTEFADYATWDGLYDVSELSVVTVPRLPGAGSIK